MPTAEEKANIARYERFLEVVNARDYDGIAEVMSSDFEDHHPGFQVHGIDSYREALRSVVENLPFTARLLDIMASGDRIVARVELAGRHTGPFLGHAATGREVVWTTTEIWRVADGLFVERWAEDDLLGLERQLSPDEENVAVITKLNDVVNERRYDDMDALFSPDFVDRNAAWAVKDVAELKSLLAVAHEALDFTSHHDLIYAAGQGMVVIHITFKGRHVKPFFGQEPTGEPVQWTSIETYRLERGRIVERWVEADTAGLMRQLGVALP
ncbi:ester cyclase [Streptomyces beihaiensis]|uniref:Ester cyclase n=1 Tax=Streptomyces beihaiensis TaxID=2984495 RepID=A0ABT3TW05_9ACTN|nr:ester cyclase [Streptomyces beihaiensis]MCX3060163.1 ester cyclase [Streptomyces beihaiensis]